MAPSITNSHIKGYLFNLIIYTHEPRRTEYFHELVHMVLEKFPSRVIFIELDQDEKKDYLTIEETPNHCDRINIKVSQNHIKKVPFIILKHLVPDLPVYLVWGQDPTSENEILPHLETFATRLVYDSECTSNLQEFSREMMKRLDHVTCEFTDVDWALARGWREVIGHTFKTRENHEILERCNRVNIVYNKLPSLFTYHCSTRAIYLQGWLAEKMHWDFQAIEKENQEVKITYKNVEVSLKPDEKNNFAPGDILEVSFFSSHGDEVKISLKDKIGRADIYVATADRCELPFSVPFPNVHRGLAFLKEIFYFPTSIHYRKMLEKISEIDWSLL